jgi:hypothetical protein
MVPAMQLHLINYASPKALIHQMGLRHLEFSLSVVDELRKTYFGAEILHHMFRRARDEIKEARSKEGSHGCHQGDSDHNQTASSVGVIDNDFTSELESISMLWSLSEPGDLFDRYELGFGQL